MYKLLLPVEPSGEDNVALADAITEMPLDTAEVEVILLSIFEDQDVQDLDGGRVSSQEVFEWSEMPETVGEVSAYLDDRGFSVDVRRELGNPAQTIVEMADSENVQRIVMGGRKRSRVGKALFGSVTQSVLLHSNTPVTVVMDE